MYQAVKHGLQMLMHYFKAAVPNPLLASKNLLAAQKISSSRNWQASKIYQRGSYFMLAESPSLLSRPALLVVE